MCNKESECNGTNCAKSHCGFIMSFCNKYREWRKEHIEKKEFDMK
jgi:hypothetical protein